MEAVRPIADSSSARVHEVSYAWPSRAFRIVLALDEPVAFWVELLTNKSWVRVSRWESQLDALRDMSRRQVKVLKNGYPQLLGSRRQ
jgi:hypothetical protein